MVYVLSYTIPALPEFLKMVVLVFGNPCADIFMQLLVESVGKS